MKTMLMSIGTYIVIEAIGSLIWKYNDKSLLAQSIRISRVVCGMIIMGKNRKETL